ncbi:hypothetical protein BFP97_04255 [Roseivirga sp. 4D4]|uniref:DUF6090 family protein n=1 Tax=Roseivirga sp. 4D4 TaxID=1889784 RepID=UPI000852A4BF|nr:DUF6090 family protein [Roseivirga sp. 4D4]OEK00766.1 hypothetical protein BFP97_04255 [Roseivirga sp. 4D4]
MKGRRVTFGAILLEIIIVIIGISIAFGLSNWGERRKEVRMGDEFVRTMINDLKSDSAAFVYQIANVQENISNVESFMDMCRRKDFREDSVRWYVGNFMNKNNWLINSNTYEILKSGGKLDIITDFELRSDISFFYRIRTYQTDVILEQNLAFEQNQMNPYLTKHSDYFISDIPDNGFVRDIEFQNLLGRWRDLKEGKLSIYENTLEDIKALIPKLEAYLE